MIGDFGGPASITQESGRQEGVMFIEYNTKGETMNISNYKQSSEDDLIIEKAILYL